MVGSNAFVVTKFLLLVLLPSMVSGALLGKDEKEAMLAEHNQKRCMAGVPALVWDDDLAKAASSYADTKPGGQHSTALGAFKKYGECIQGACPHNDPAKAMKFWYDSELPEYTAPFTATHYTQVVWKATTKVGCGKGPSTNLCDGGKLYVCQYLPLGNQYGKYDDNVIAPKKDKSQCPLEASSATASDGGDDDNAAHVMTDEKCQCKDNCAKRGESYTWCHTTDSCKDNWDYCKASATVMTDEGCQCKENCAKQGESYTWCHTTDSCKDNWDYCKPSRLFDENVVPNMAVSSPNMAFLALAMFTCALLMVGAVVAARRRAKPANHAQGRDLMEAMENSEDAAMLE